MEFLLLGVVIGLFFSALVILLARQPQQRPVVLKVRPRPGNGFDNYQLRLPGEPSARVFVIDRQGGERQRYTVYFN